MTYSIADSCEDNAASRLGEFVRSQRRVVLFGAGRNGEYVSHYMNYIQASVEAFVDNDRARIGSVVNGCPVRSPHSLAAASCGVVITSERYADEIIRQVLSLGVERRNVYVLRQSELQLMFDNDPGWPEYAIENHSIPFFRAYLEDRGIDFSGDVIENKGYRFPNVFRAPTGYKKSFFAAYLDYVLPALSDDYSMVVEGPAEFGNVGVDAGDVVLDCGANVGLFSLVAAAKGADVHAIEPMPELVNYLGRAQAIAPGIHVWSVALSNESGSVEMSFREDGATTAASCVLDAGDRRLSVKATTVDRFLKENGIARCDFIKADIEGAERFMLQGARETLRELCPRLSICTYHLPDDREVLERIIKEANPRYVIEHRWQKLYAYVPGPRGRMSKAGAHAASA